MFLLLSIYHQQIGVANHQNGPSTSCLASLPSILRTGQGHLETLVSNWGARMGGWHPATPAFWAYLGSLDTKFLRSPWGGRWVAPCFLYAPIAKLQHNETLPVLRVPRLPLSSTVSKHESRILQAETQRPVFPRVERLGTGARVR